MTKIVAIKIYQIDLPLKEGRYSWADGKYVEVFGPTGTLPTRLSGFWDARWGLDLT